MKKYKSIILTILFTILYSNYSNGQELPLFRSLYDSIFRTTCKNINPLELEYFDTTRIEDNFAYFKDSRFLDIDLKDAPLNIEYLCIDSRKSIYSGKQICNFNRITKFTNLKMLIVRGDLTQKEIKILNKSMLNFNKLQFLEVSIYDYIFPKEILSLDSLLILSLKLNNDKLPNQISSLKNLKWLTLEFDSISCLPNEIYSMKNLEGLDVESKSSFYIMESITQLPELKFLYLSIIINDTNVNYFSNFENLKNLNVDKILLNDVRNFEIFKKIEFLTACKQELDSDKWLKIKGIIPNTKLCFFKN